MRVAPRLTGRRASGRSAAVSTGVGFVLLRPRDRSDSHEMKDSDEQAMPQIRVATAGDARAIAQVHVASWRAAYSGLLPKDKLDRLDVDERERLWRERLTDANGVGRRAWVAIHKDQVVGFAFTQPSADEDVAAGVHELKALYLLPSVWQRGLGSALLSTAESSLRDAGVDAATLWVLEGNEPAKSFYEARGWKFDKRDPSFKPFNAPALRYTKQL